MMKTLKNAPTLMALAAFALAPFAANAQFRHPAYLHARSDLRRATLLMRIPDEPNVNRDMAIAVDFTERAIRELDIAARFDRKDLEDHPPIDTRLGRGGRFREILRLLDSARDDIEREEDNPAAREWRNRAFRNIDDAMALVRKGGYDKFRDETYREETRIPPPAVHPRYLQAISDLRYARALLYRPDWGPVMRDQRAAVEEIDRAIGEAKRAAIDDGKNPDEHPPIDRALGWEGRFRKAMELLDSAERDLSFAESNGAAAGWRNASLTNVRAAKAFVAKAMRDSWWR
jgi:tetratricopeptide (TPR) repeat protein